MDSHITLSILWASPLKILMELNKSIHNDSLFIRVGLSGNLMVSIQRLYHQTGILKISNYSRKVLQNPIWVYLNLWLMDKIPMKKVPMESLCNRMKFKDTVIGCPCRRHHSLWSSFPFVSDTYKHLFIHRTLDTQTLPKSFQPRCLPLLDLIKIHIQTQFWLSPASAHGTLGSLYT
jgi:hypothetical protein